MRTSSVDHILLDTLGTENTHLTSLQLYERIRSRLPAVNPSTVYRSLERLVRHGRVSVSDIGAGAVVYEKVSEGAHHHLICQNCRKEIALDADRVGDFFGRMEKQTGFKIVTNHLVLFGICTQCQAEEPKG